MWKTPMYDTTKLTVELRDIVESGTNIWNFDYPSFYKGEQKTAFEKKVIDNFYFRQIGQETVGRFLHMFRTRVQTIMPYYVQLYESEALMKSIEDPFGNVDITETYKSEGSFNNSDNVTTENGVTTNTTGESSKSTNNTVSKEGSETLTKNDTEVYMDTPQGKIVGGLADVTHATNETMKTGTEENDIDTTESLIGSEVTNESEDIQTTENGSEQATRTGSDTTEYTLTRKGNQGVNTYAHDMKELRDTFLNIDQMIINDLNVLFLGVY